MKSKSFLFASAVLLMVGATAMSAFGQATRPQTAEAKNSAPDIEKWVSDLGSSNAQTRSDAKIALLLEPPEAFEKIQGAVQRQSLPPDVRKQLTEIVDRIKPWQAARVRYDLCWAKAKATGQKTPDKATWDKSWPWDHEVVNFWPDLARDKIPPRLLVHTAEQFTTVTFKIGADMTPFFNIVESPLDHVLPKALLLRYKGCYYKDYAWRARGGDWAYKVSPQNMQLFEERLALAERNYSWNSSVANSCRLRRQV